MYLFVTVTPDSQFLASMQLDMDKLKSEPERLPQSLLEKCAAISVRPNAVKDLVDVMGSEYSNGGQVIMYTLMLQAFQPPVHPILLADSGRKMGVWRNNLLCFRKFAT